jgi:CTP synthase (UTP-ammonia lyase)
VTTAALEKFAGFWLVPGSPYRSMAGALAVVRFARERAIPFLGTCGGFQHALLEFARQVAGLTTADHAETNATADVPLIAPLSCSLVEVTGPVRLIPGSRIQKAYGTTETDESYHCRFGLNENYRAALESAGFWFTAFDEAGAVRGGELRDHPFFVGTLFQSERRALRDEPVPLASALVAAVLLK